MGTTFLALSRQFNAARPVGVPTDSLTYRRTFRIHNIQDYKAEEHFIYRMLEPKNKAKNKKQSTR
jgi:hypothetical protein